MSSRRASSTTPSVSEASPKAGSDMPRIESLPQYGVQSVLHGPQLAPKSETNCMNVSDHFPTVFPGIIHVFAVQRIAVNRSLLTD